jgi:putative DNA primase/helicase
MSDAKSTVDRALIEGQQKKEAEDWLAAFSKRSEEALAKRAAEKQVAKPPDEKALIEALSRKDHTEYDRMRSEVADTLGMRVGTLDEKVEAVRRGRVEEDPLPHWNVEPWPEEVDGDALLDEMRRLFRRYIILPPGADIAIPLWVLHAWTYDAGDISPFLAIISPTHRCGKTNTLTLLLYLTPKSELASNVSPTAIFRYVELSRPTLLMDEADTSVNGHDEVRGILNSGHTKVGAYCIRNVEQDGEHIPRRFSTWCPKAVGCIGKPAATIEDRSIVIMQQRKTPAQKVERLRKRDSTEFADLRRKAKRWASDNFNQLTDPDPAVPDRLHDRAADNWRPLLAIADLAGGEWPERGREAACLLSGESHDDTIGVKLLEDIRLAFGEDDAIRSADLVAKLAEDPERPWAEWKHGRPLSQNQLGRLLSKFGITSETVDIPGLKSAKGYRRSRFEAAWAAYCPDTSGQNPLPAQNGFSKRRTVEVPVESAQVGDFQSVERRSFRHF